MPETYFKRVETLGEVIVEGFHLLGLFVIGATIVWASWAELLLIIQVCRYLVKDFGTSQSLKSTRQRDSRYCPDRPALI
ncbi:MAG: hypothetical protein AB2813_01085, partial [Candidatus Sedimenticola endophacoides]